MGIDYAPTDELGGIRSRLFDNYVQQAQQVEAARPLSDRDPGFAFLAEASRQRLEAGPNPTISRLFEVQAAANNIRQKSEQDTSALYSRAGALQLTKPEDVKPSEEPPTVLGGLNNVLRIVDTPRRLVFQHAFVPLARRAGVDVPDDLAPEGREFLLRALGGDAVEQSWATHLSSFGRAGTLAASVPFALAGVALDVLIDPITYLTFGAVGAVKAGGRVLSPAGRAFQTALEEGVTVASREVRGAFRSAAAAEARQLHRQVIEAPTTNARRALRAELDDMLAIAHRVTESGVPLTAPQQDKVFALMRTVGTDLDEARKLFQPGGAQWGFPGPILGAIFKLPANTVALRVPLLNREDQLAVFLGGHEVGGAALHQFDTLRRNLIGLGEAVLARVPTNVQRALGGAAGAAVGASGAFGLLPEAYRVPAAFVGGLLGAAPDVAQQKLRAVFVNYGQLQGWGRDVFRERIKWARRLPRSEAESAARTAQRAYEDLSEEQKRDIFYILNEGPVKIARDVEGQPIRLGGEVVPIYETLEDHAARLNDINLQRYRTRQALQGLGLFSNIQPPTEITAAQIRERLKDKSGQLSVWAQDVYKRRELEQTVRHIWTLPETLRPPGVTFPTEGTLRGLQVLPVAARRLTTRPGQYAAVFERGGKDPWSTAELLQWEIDRAFEYSKNGLIPSRYSVSELLAPENVIGGRQLFELIEPDERVRNVVAAMVVGERELAQRAAAGTLVQEGAVARDIVEAGLLNPYGFAGPQMGPLAAATRYAQDFGQESFLLNWMRHIYLPDAPGVSRRQAAVPPQPGQRMPANIRKQRIATFLSEPEVLDALGVITDPEVITAKTLGQYRLMLREAQFIGWTLNNFGRQVIKGERPEGWNSYDPREWFTKGMVHPEDMVENVKLFKAADNISAEEAETFLELTATRRGSKKTEWILPQDVIDALQENRRIVSNSGGVTALLDRILAFQRTMVTTIWPAYHTRNVVGNALNSALEGVPLAHLRSYVDAWDILRIKDEGAPLPVHVRHWIERASPQAGRFDTAGAVAPEQTTVGWLLRYLEERGVYRTSPAAVDLQILQAGQDPASPRLLSRANEWWPFRAGRTAAETLDNVAKIRHLLVKLEQGSTLEDAVLSVKRVLFDYGDLSLAEQKFFRPAAYFWTWTRRNLPLQLEMLVHQPRNLQYWNHILRAVTDRDAQRSVDAALMPAYLREQMGAVFTEDERGRVVLASSFGLPVEDLNLFSAKAPEGLIRRFLGISNPLIQFVLNSAGLPSGFTNRQIDDDAYQSYYRQLAPWYASAIQVVPGLADAIQLRESKFVDAEGRERTRYSANPWAIYTLYNLLAMGRLLRFGRDVNRLWEDPVTSRAVGLASRTLTGVRLTDVDVERPLEALSVSTETEDVNRQAATALERLARELQGGEIDAMAWRSRRSDVLTAKRAQLDRLLVQQLRKEGRATGEQLTAEQKAVAEKARRGFAAPGQQLLDLIFSLDPLGKNPLYDGNGDGIPEGDKPFISASEFAAVRKELLARLQAEFPESARRYDALRRRRIEELPPAAQRLEFDYQRAVELLDEYESVPKYLNLSAARAREVDVLRNNFKSLSQARGAAQARDILQRRKPAEYQRMVSAIPNRFARQQAWRRLNSRNDNLLLRFFGNIRLEEYGLGPSGGEASSVA